MDESSQKQKRLILFDFDGVIANTINIILESAEIISRKINSCKKPSESMIRNLKKMSFEELAKDMNISDDKIKDFVNEIISIMDSKISEIEIYQNMKKVLEKLSKNHLIGIITGNSKENVIKFLSKYSLEKTIDFIAANNKPQERALKIITIQKYFGITKDNTYFTGDAVSDIKAAKKAGVHSIAVTWGNQNINLLKKSTPEFIVNNPLEILNIINTKKE